MNKITFVLFAVLSLVSSLPAWAGGTACLDVTVESVQIRPNGVILVGMSSADWGFELFVLCDLNTDQGLVTADLCPDLKNLAVAAQLTETPVSFVYDNVTGPSSCADWKNFESDWPFLSDHFKGFSIEQPTQ